jgi:hypothetical protein
MNTARIPAHQATARNASCEEPSVATSMVRSRSSVRASEQEEFLFGIDRILDGVQDLIEQASAP